MTISSTVADSYSSAGLRVPFLDLSAQYEQIKSELEEAVLRVVRSGQYILGPDVAALEEEIAAYSGCGYGVAISSGTDALLVCLMSEGIGQGDEVIVPNYSFFATAGVVRRIGATPVFVDIDPDTFNIDAEAAARAVTNRTRAIIPVHLYGQMADMDAISELASKRGLLVIEDAAQAIGAEYKGRRAGSIGEYGCLSFFPSKNLGGLGDGGMVVTSDAARAERVRILRNHGAKAKYYHQLVGGNFRLDAIQAASLRVKLRYLDGWTSARQRNAAWYREALEGAEGIAPLRESVDRTHVYNQFVLTSDRRETIRASLTAASVGSEVYYPLPFHRQPCFADLTSAIRAFPVSEWAARTSFAIPVYPELSAAMRDSVVMGIKDCLPGRE